MTENNNKLSDEKQKVNTDRLKGTLILLLAVLPGVAILSLLFFSNINDERILRQQAGVLLEYTSSESITHAANFLKSVENQLQLTANIFEKNIVAKADHAALENLLIAQLEINLNIDGLYTTNLEGDFYYVSRSVDPSIAKYRVKAVDKSQQGSISRIWWRNPDSSDIYQETPLPNDEYDPRTRDWYKEVLAKNNTIWTNPYPFFTTKQYGLTTATPIHGDNGDIYGVVGADVELTELVNLLDKLEIIRYGSTFITTADGLLIASANMHELNDTTDDIKRELFLNIASSKNTLAKMAYKAVFTDNQTTFTIDGKEFLVESLPLKISDDEYWRIISFAEKNAFLSEIRKRSNQQYILAGLVTVFSILLGWFLAKTVWKPLDRLEDNANYDQLTKLYNRRFLDNRAEELIETAILQDQPLTVAILDIDKFKSINDTYGHAIGDLVIQIFASRLRNQNRPLDLLARFGGEEFVVVMPNTTLEVALSHINNSRITMKDRAYTAEEHSLKVTFSAGIAQLDKDNKTLADILKNADKALYESKKSGRDRVSII